MTTAQSERAFWRGAPWRAVDCLRGQQQRRSAVEQIAFAIKRRTGASRYEKEGRARDVLEVGIMGRRAKAQRLLQELPRRSWVPSVDVAAIYNALGDRRNALLWLERARERREFDALFVPDDPRFQNLRSEGALQGPTQT
jgi:hypothetical protein